MDSDEFKKQKELLSHEPWFGATLTKQQAQAWVRRNGEFLVRISEHSENTFILTTKWNGRFVHLPVKTNHHPNDPDMPKWLYLFEEFEFINVVDLIKYHWIHQLPMTRQSEAVIYRPINCTYTCETSDLNLNHLSVKLKNHYPSKLVADRQHLQKNTNLTASVNDFTLLNRQFLHEKLSKGCSFHDLRLQSYAIPEEILGNDSRSLEKQYSGSPKPAWLKPSTMSGSCGTHLKSFDEVCHANSMDNNDLSTGPNKTCSINRKNIRYVEMSDPSVRNLNMPPIIGRTHSTNDLSSTPIQDDPSTRKQRKLSSPICWHENFITYDLSLVTIPNLLPLIGHIHRPMNVEVFHKIAEMLTDGKCCSSLEFSGQLVLQTGKIFLDWPRKVQPEIDESNTAFEHGFSLIFMPKVSTYREDILLRYRSLSLFVMATILTSKSLSERSKMLIFWLECCRCLFDIYRDNYSLGSLVQAVLSDGIINLKETWKEVQKANPRLVQTSYLEHLRTYLLTELPHDPKNDQLATASSFYDLKSRVPNICQILNQLHSVTFENAQADLSIDQDLKDKTMLIQAWKTLRSCPSKSLWLRDICSTMDTTVTSITELVRTETLMLLLVGPATLDGYSSAQMLLDKVEQFLQGLSLILQQ